MSVATTLDDAEFVRRARELLGLTQTEFGDRIGVSYRTVWRWENGEPIRKDRDRKAIADLIKQRMRRRKKR